MHNINSRGNMDLSGFCYGRSRPTGDNQQETIAAPSVTEWHLSRTGGYADAPTGPNFLNSADHQPTLEVWIASHRGRVNIKPMDIAERRKYLEKSVHLLHSFVSKIASGYNGNTSKDSQALQVHPNFITIENIIVQEPRFRGGKEVTADFVECGDSIFCNVEVDQTRKKYLAMDALGRMAYEIIMLGEGPSVVKFCSKTSAVNMSTLSSALNIHDRETVDNVAVIDEEDEIIDMLRKNPRTTTSEEMNGSGIVPAMVNASVPFPLCRFVSDLLDGEDAMLGRSERSFSSFNDVLSDLKQMVDGPDAFLHASSPDRWKLVFGEKLYGRDDDMKAFLGAADRVATLRDDPVLRGKGKEVVMVLGNSGAGKSRLVRLGGASLEKRGWRFLHCKFDRVINPEPLSILAYAFDEYFGLFASCPKHGMKSNGDISPIISDLECSCLGYQYQEIQQRLERIISPEGLGILAKHIPSLRLVLSVPPLTDTNEVNEKMMHTLFGQLLQALSSKKSPILFFIDDLQWADPLSLALLTVLVKGTLPDLMRLISADNNKGNGQVGREQDTNVMFVGSYRDNEVDDDHQLANVLRKFHSDSSINVTNISLSGFTFETLNEMLSESLCVPLRRVRSLSELIIQKTDGHPLHVIEFIQALTMDNLLTHSFERGWEWDADSIDIFPITDSVAELFTFKLQRLPNHILLGLQILSCFGSQIDQHVLGFVADYDGESSVDMTSAIRVALSEGLIERAAQWVSFSHDMIQKATIDSISEDVLVSLLRKLVAALFKNASAAGELDSVLFVIVDLVNRIGSEATSSPKERAHFAELNLCAGSKACQCPDFTAAAKYAENGITFLNFSCWETQYDLSLSLYETAILSHFSSLEGHRDQLMKRINAVFEHAKDFGDKFKTHCVWIKLLSMKDVSRAIEESLNALERLGEPLDLANIDHKTVCAELKRTREQFSGERKKKFLSTNHLADCNKVRAMQIMSSLLVYYNMQKSFLGAFVSCSMIGMSMEFGHREDRIFGTAAFASALVIFLDDIDEGTAWAHTTLSLMKMYNEDALIPSVYGPIYGIVLSWKEPIQSTLEPLAQGIRSSFAVGNVEFAMVNTIYYIARSFNCGKNVSVLLGEVETLARQHGNHFGNDSSSDTPVYSPLLQFFLTPLFNTLRDFEGDKDTPGKNEEEASFPLDKVKLVNNDDIMKTALQTEQYSSLHTVLSYQTVKAFIFRDMDRALQYTDMYVEHFLTKDFKMRYNVFYEALITFHFARQTGEERYRIRGENALLKMKDWSKHSDWNFNNKVLLMEAESHNTQKDFDKAATYYEASINAAQEHKFIHEEAISNELAGNFFYERGLHSKSYKFFMQSRRCYEKWGAHAVARRVENGNLLLASQIGGVLLNSYASSDELQYPQNVLRGDLYQPLPALPMPSGPHALRVSQHSRQSISLGSSQHSQNNISLGAEQMPPYQSSQLNAEGLTTLATISSRNSVSRITAPTPADNSYPSPLSAVGVSTSSIDQARLQTKSSVMAHDCLLLGAEQMPPYQSSQLNAEGLTALATMSSRNSGSHDTVPTPAVTRYPSPLSAGDATASSLDQGQRKEPTHPSSLFIQSDISFLGPLHSFLRGKCIEVFASTKEDMTAQGRGARPSKIGQVGLRCCFCKGAPKEMMAKQAVCYPSKRATMYESARNFHRFHMQACQFIPEKPKAEYTYLTDQESTLPKRPNKYMKAYYAEAASELGIVDTPNGLVFGAPHNTSGIPYQMLNSLLQAAESPTTSSSFWKAYSPVKNEAVTLKKFEQEASDSTKRVIINAKMEPTPFVYPEDFPTVSDFDFVLFHQVIPCTPSIAMLKQKILHDGQTSALIGFCCKHCACTVKGTNQKDKGAFFPTDLNSLAETSFLQRLLNHFMNCPNVPPEVKDAFDELKRLASEHGPIAKRGLRRRFIKKIYERMKIYSGLKP